MKKSSFLLAIALFLEISAPTTAQDEFPDRQREFVPALILETPLLWREGSEINIRITSSDPEIASCSLVYEGDRIPLGGKPRGRISGVILPARRLLPDVDDPLMSSVDVEFKPPYYDTVRLKITAKGFGADGQLRLSKSVCIDFLPSVVPADLKTGVVVSKKLQRLYAAKDGRIKAAYMVSTGRKHKDGGGPTPEMSTRIHNKSVVARSRRYAVDMRFWNCITTDGRYGIHATSPRLYRNLGRPDSHGCIRLHGTDARQFYAMFPVGTPVYIVK